MRDVPGAAFVKKVCSTCGALKAQKTNGYRYCAPCRSAASSRLVHSAETRAKLSSGASRRAPERERQRRVARCVTITRLGCWECGRAVRDRLRCAWTREYGPIPLNKQLNHRCDNGDRCFNPEHVYAGTKSDNTQDAHAARLGRPGLRALPLPDDWGPAEVELWRKAHLAKVAGVRKVCPKCGVEKALTEFYSKKGGPQGVCPRCIECTNADRRARRQAEKTNRPAGRQAAERKLPAPDQLAPCVGCGTLIPERLWCSAACRRGTRDVAG